jgi:hypothetical protein
VPNTVGTQDDSTGIYVPDLYPGIPDARPAIQAAIDSASKNGGTVSMTRPGTFEFSLAGDNPYQPGTENAFNITGNDVSIYLGPGVVLKLKSNQQTDAGGFAFGFVWKDRNRIRFYGPGTIDMNCQNQPGWTQGFEQQWGGHLNGYASAVGGGCNDNSFDGLTFLNTFGNPINIGELGPTGNAISERVSYTNLKARVFGEGFQMIGVRDFVFNNVELDDRGGTSKGDAMETSNCVNGSIVSCRVYGDGKTATAGSSIDLYGSKDVAISDCLFNGYNNGITMQTNPAGASIVDRITISNCVYDSLRAGDLLGDGSVNYSNCIWRNIQVTCPIQGGSTVPGASARLTGCTFQNCFSLYFGGSVSVSFTGCEIIGGTSHGLVLYYQGPEVPRLEWTGGRITACNGAAIVVGSNGLPWAPTGLIRGADLQGCKSGTWITIGGGTNSSISVGGDTLTD